MAPKNGLKILDFSEEMGGTIYLAGDGAVRNADHQKSPRAAGFFMVCVVM